MDGGGFGKWRCVDLGGGRQLSRLSSRRIGAGVERERRWEEGEGGSNSGGGSSGSCWWLQACRCRVGDAQQQKAASGERMRRSKQESSNNGSVVVQPRLVLVLVLVLCVFAPCCYLKHTKIDSSVKRMQGLLGREEG